MKFILFFFSVIILAFISFGNSVPPEFENRINKGAIENNDIDEASGIAASYKYNDIFWVHNDSGNENYVYAIGEDGSNKGIYLLKNIENRDWEDIAVGYGPVLNESYIYIGDIGDNSAQFPIKYIYRFEEPELPQNPDNIVEIQDVSIIQFFYPDGERDAETLMIDPLTNDLYVIGKRDSDIRLYRLPYPQSVQGFAAAELAVKFKLSPDPESNTPENYLTAGDISSDGTEILLKSYTNIFYWKRDSLTSIAETLVNDPVILPYVQEPQGEAICWQNYENSGYYTLSEENINIGGVNLTFPAMLYFYPRKIATEVIGVKYSPSFNLSQNYPNPFNPSTTIKYSVPKSAERTQTSVMLIVYDNLGNELEILVNKKQAPGHYDIQFNADKLSTGIYYYKLIIDEYQKVKKMMLLK